MCLLHDLLLAYWIVLLARVILSWVRTSPTGALRPIYDLVFALTEPVLRLARGVLPTVRMGGMGMDLSPLIPFLVLSILLSAIHC